MGKQGLFAAIGLVLGLGLGFLLWAGKGAPVGTAPAGSYDEARAKLQALADTDIAEYARLKDLEARYKKADEILGKILVIFLADLGIRTKLTEALAKSASDPGAREDVRAAVKAAEKLAGDVAKSAETAKKVAAASEGPSWVEQEKGLDEVSGKDDVEDFLQKARVEDFDKYLKSSAVFSNRSNLVDALNGKFVGHTQVVRGGEGPEKWIVTLDLNAKMENGKLKGTYAVSINVNGKPSSDNGDSGHIRSLREFVGHESRGFVITTGPGRYFQVYYIRASDSLAGNVYEQDPATLGWSVVGTFIAPRAR